MKRLIQPLSVLSLACLLIAGCAKDDALSRPGGEVPDGRPVPLTVSNADVQVSEAATRGTAGSTRAATAATRAGTTTLSVGSKIGVFLANGEKVTSYSPKNNVCYKRNENSWNATGEQIYLTLEDAAVCAYYPYSSTVTDSKNVILTPTLLDDGIEPLAYATNVTANSTKQHVTFNLQQACSWLVLNITRGNVPDDINLTGIVLAGSGLSKEYKLDITTGNSSGQTAADGGKITFALPAEVPLPANTTASNPVVFNLSMPPTTATISGGLTIGVKIKEYNKMMSTTIKGLTALERGKKYKVNLTVDGTAMTATSVEVIDWKTSTVNNNNNPWIPLP